MPNENTEFKNAEDELPDHLEGVHLDENGNLVDDESGNIVHFNAGKDDD